MKKLSGKALVFLVSGWVVVIVAALVVLVLYEFKAGDRGEGVADIQTGLQQLFYQPVSSELTSDLREAIGLDNSAPIAVVFLHPQCPCSRATVNEIERALSLPATKEGHVVFVSYSDEIMDESWNVSALVRKAGTLERSTLLFDENSAIATAFGARISGEALVFDALGHLQFHGGVTTSRGHEGPNPGIEALVEVLSGLEPSRSALPVYGCVLSDPMTGMDMEDDNQGSAMDTQL